MTTHLISLEKVSSKEVVCMFSSLPCKRITVDNSIVLTFCSVSIPFLQNKSTVLLFVFCAFYGAVKKSDWNEINTSHSYFGLEMVPNRSLP